MLQASGLSVASVYPSIRQWRIDVNKKIFSITLSLIFALGCSVNAFAQVDVATATLKGAVKDPNGAVVPKATITLLSTEKGTSRSVVTDEDGNYRIPLIQPGTYDIEVQADGFSKAVTRNVAMSIGQSLVYDIVLQVGAITTAIEITTEAPLIQIEQTQQANTISQRQVENLPNINRNMTAAVFTLPGVGDAAATRSQQPGFTGFGTTGFSIGGSNGRNNLSTIDGGENEYGSGQYRVFVPVDAIQEYQVNRNAFAAEFGFTVGSSVNLVTKSGSNLFHGSAYGYFRNNSTSAITFIDRLRTSIPAIGEEPFHQNVYGGGTFGGPIKKQKLFFFVSYEYQKLDNGGFNFFLDSPAALGISGTTSRGIAQRQYVNLLANSGNATLAGIAAQWNQTLVPQNNATLVKLVSPDNGAVNSLTKSHNVLTRIDWQASDRNTLNFRFGHARALANADSFPSGSSLVTRDYSIFANWARTFGTSVVNQLRVQIVPHNRADNIPNADRGSIADPSVLNQTPSAITIDGFAIGGFVPSFTFGHPAAIPYLANQRRYQFEDTLSWTKGNHSFKFGASYRPVDYFVEDDLYFAGQYLFGDGTYPLILAGLAPAQQGALVGYNRTHRIDGTLCSSPGAADCIPNNGPTAANLSGPQSFTFNLTRFVHSGFNNPKWQDWAHYFGAFAQDSWKVSSNFSLDYGFRVDVDGEPTPLNTNTYISPRVGFAWSPFGNHNTVIRGGGGLFYGPIPVLVPSYSALLDDSGQYINQIFPLGLASASIYQAGVAAGLLPFGHLSEEFLHNIRNSFFPNGVQTGQGNANRVVFVAHPKYENPYSVQASFSIQRELVRNLSLEVGYLMYHGLHLQMPVEINLKETGVVDPFLGPKYVRKDPTILQQVGYESRGKSIYHGLTVSLNKRFSGGLQFGTNYTYSKSIDDVIDFSSSQAWFRPTRLNLFRGVSVFDFTHVFSANAVYRLPFTAGADQNFLSHVFADMTVGPILTMRSGIPFSIRTPSITNVETSNPDGTSTGIAGTSTNAIFASPYASARNSSRGDAYYSLDLRLQKSVFISRDRGIRVDIIADVSNLLNTTNFNKVWDEFASPYPALGFAGAPTANPVVTLDSGQQINLLTGPYNVKGFAPTTVDQLQGHPGAFVDNSRAREIQFGVKVVF